MRFLGTIEAKTDAKGRAFLPAAFRKMLQSAGEERMMLRKDVFQPCLVLYPESVWNEQMDELQARLNKWNKAHRELFRRFMAEVEPITLDGNGRFLISKRFQQMAGIRQDIRFIGMDDTIEIWSNDSNDMPTITAEDFGRELEMVMGDENSGNQSLQASHSPK